MDTEKQRQRRRNDEKLTESRDDRSEQLFVTPTESLLTNGEWLPEQLLGGSERRTPGWFSDMNIRLVIYIYIASCTLFNHPKIFVCLHHCPVLGLNSHGLGWSTACATFDTC